MPDLFDPDRRLIVRDRAARMGADDFLHRRALDDMVERLSLLRRRFDRVLLLGCIARKTADEVRAMFANVDLVEPAPVLASRLDARHEDDLMLDVEPGRYDLVLSLNTIAEANEPLDTLLRLRFALAPGGLLLGALVGGESLPRLREAMRAADALSGKASPHVHPRIDPAGLTQLLAQAGLREPVVDVDRVELRYASLARLVEDLRRMGASNMLGARAVATLGRREFDAAARQFGSTAFRDGKTSEFIDILHFAGWQDASDAD